MATGELTIRMGSPNISITYRTDRRDRPLSAVWVKPAAGNPQRGWLTAEGWTGDDIEGFILTELGSLLMDDPKLSADQLTAMMARRGKALEAVPR